MIIIGLLIVLAIMLILSMQGSTVSEHSSKKFMVMYIVTIIGIVLLYAARLFGQVV